MEKVKCVIKNYAQDTNGKWKLTDKRTESVDQNYYNHIVRNLDLECDTRRAYGFTPFGSIKEATFYGFDRQFKTIYEFM